jgi:uncharacterized hydrophobic protein (TIGR00271 family)
VENKVNSQHKITEQLEEEESKNIIQFFKKILSLKGQEINYFEVLKEVKEDIVFKGYNVWILIASIIIASIGLNLNSIAVVIGAMLISPLMGPIKGVGVAIGTNDFNLLKKALKSWGITVSVSIITSYLYFLISPLNEITNELFARTEPTFLDVIIAFAGGFAGILAAVRGENDTVIPGVAIATALMPPLCTAGFGLATGEWNFFFGAFYLFLINSILIVFATVLVVRYLHFPKRQYVDPIIEKKAKNYIIIFLVILLTPSVYLFYKIIKENNFENNSASFVHEVVEKSNVGKVKYYIGVSPDSTYLDIDIIGGYANQEIINQWNDKKKDYHIENTKLHVFQGPDIGHLETKLKELEEREFSNQQILQVLVEQLKLIDKLNQKVESLSQTIEENEFIQIFTDSVYINHPSINKLSIQKSIDYSKQIPDTLFIIKVNFKPNTNKDSLKNIKLNLYNSFKSQLMNQLHKQQDSIPILIY